MTTAIFLNKAFEEEKIIKYMPGYKFESLRIGLYLMALVYKIYTKRVKQNIYV